MKKILLFLFFLLVCAMSLSPGSYAQEVIITPEAISEEITGKIEEINYETSFILVKNYVDESMDIYQEDNIYVLEEAVIEKDGNYIKFNDLLKDERITVRCRITADGRKEADHIWIKNK